MRSLVSRPYILAVDSTLLRSEGKVWYKPSIEKGVAPRSGIDIDARWGISHTKGWIFGYKLQMTCNTDSPIVPLTADVTTANMSNNPVYPDLTASASSSHFSGLSFEITLKAGYMVGNGGIKL